MSAMLCVGSFPAMERVGRNWQMTKFQKVLLNCLKAVCRTTQHLTFYRLNQSGVERLKDTLLWKPPFDVQ